MFELVFFGQLVPVQPLDGAVTLVYDGRLVRFGDFVLDFVILEGEIHVGAIGFERVLDGDFLTRGFVLLFELLR